MKWEYKIVTTDTLLRKPDDHDIAVSKIVVSTRKNAAQESLEKELNSLGEDGWEFVTMIGEFGIFKKQVN